MEPTCHVLLQVNPILGGSGYLGQNSIITLPIMRVLRPPPLKWYMEENHQQLSDMGCPNLPLMTSTGITRKGQYPIKAQGAPKKCRINYEEEQQLEKGQMSVI